MVTASSCIKTVNFIRFARIDVPGSIVFHVLDNTACKIAKRNILYHCLKDTESSDSFSKIYIQTLQNLKRKGTFVLYQPIVDFHKKQDLKRCFLIGPGNQFSLSYDHKQRILPGDTRSLFLSRTKCATSPNASITYSNLSSAASDLFLRRLSISCGVVYSYLGTKIYNKSSKTLV